MKVNNIKKERSLPYNLISHKLPKIKSLKSTQATRHIFNKYATYNDSSIDSEEKDIKLITKAMNIKKITFKFPQKEPLPKVKSNYDIFISSTKNIKKSPKNRFFDFINTIDLNAVNRFNNFIYDEKPQEISSRIKSNIFQCKTNTYDEYESSLTIDDNIIKTSIDNLETFIKDKAIQIRKSKNNFVINKDIFKNSKEQTSKKRNIIILNSKMNDNLNSESFLNTFTLEEQNFFKLKSKVKVIKPILKKNPRLIDSTINTDKTNFRSKAY